MEPGQTKSPGVPSILPASAPSSRVLSKVQRRLGEQGWYLISTANLVTCLLPGPLSQAVSIWGFYFTVEASSIPPPSTSEQRWDQLQPSRTEREYGTAVPREATRDVPRSGKSWERPADLGPPWGLSPKWWQSRSPVGEVQRGSGVAAVRSGGPRERRRWLRGSGPASRGSGRTPRGSDLVPVQAP